jgi:hypothetical protein
MTPPTTTPPHAAEGTAMLAVDVTSHGFGVSEIGTLLGRLGRLTRELFAECLGPGHHR